MTTVMTMSGLVTMAGRYAQKKKKFREKKERKKSPDWLITVHSMVLKSTKGKRMYKIVLFAHNHIFRLRYRM